MARTKSVEKSTDPATGRPLPQGVTHLGALRYRTRKLVDGKRVNKTFPTAKLAREWLESASVAVRAGNFVDSRPLDKMTVLAMVEKYVGEMMQEGGPRRGYKQDLGHVPALRNDEIAALPLSKLTPFAVRNFRVRQIKAGYAKGTVVKRMNLLASMLKYATSEWGMPLVNNVASGKLVSRPKGADQKRNRRLRVPSAAAQRLAESRGEGKLATEEEVLYAVMEKSESTWNLHMVRFAVAQGTRLGEQMGMRWRHVDFEARTLTLVGRFEDGTKNEDHREELGHEVRALMPRSIEILQEIKPEDVDPEGHVFQVGGYDAFKTRIGRILRKATARMKGTMKELRYLDDLRFHDLRHEATSRLAKVFSDSKKLMKVTGHIDFKSMLRYYQPDPTELAMHAEEHELARAAGIEVDPPEVVPLAAE